LLGECILACEGEIPLLFTENETNNDRLFPGQPNASPYVKDGINNRVVHGDQGAVNPEKRGTKVAAHYRLAVGPGQSASVRLRLTAAGQAGRSTGTKGVAMPLGPEFDETLSLRLQEADAFYLRAGAINCSFALLAACGATPVGVRRHEPTPVVSTRQKGLSISISGRPGSFGFNPQGSMPMRSELTRGSETR
jgi:hypothetical protein